MSTHMNIPILTNQDTNTNITTSMSMNTTTTRREIVMMTMFLNSQNKVP